MTKLSRFLPAVALVIAACADAPTAPVTPLDPAAATATSLPAGNVAVVFADEGPIPSAGLTLISSLGGTITSRFDSIGVVFVAGLSPLGITTLAGSALTVGAGTDRVRNWLPPVRLGPTVEFSGPAPADHNDPAGASFWEDQWNMRQIQADRAWAAGFSGNPTVTVAILDTGIDHTNRELAGLVDLTRSRSFVPSDPVLTDHEVMDLHFHGTHVASSVATNNLAIAGVAPHTTLIGVKVLSFEGSGTFEGVTAGIIHAADVGSDVINMSLGARVDLSDPEVQALVEALARAIRYAEKRRTIVISAAGNNALDLDAAGAPAFVPCLVSTICVSATGPLLQQDFDQPAWYTNFGVSHVHVAAPGGNYDPNNENNYQVEDLILGACSSRSTQGTLLVCHVNRAGALTFYAFAAGTSMAAPHVSGVAAMIKANAPNLPVPALRNRILDFADDLGAAGLDPLYGHGRVNVFRSLTRN